MSGAFNRLQEAIASRTARVAVIGLIAEGMQRGPAVANRSFPVFGFDSDAKPQCGFHTANQPAALADADVLLINIPTPMTAAGSPDLAPIIRVSQTIAGQLRSGQLILLERTAYPGMTREVIQPPLDKRRLKIGEDYFLGVAPRSLPGTAVSAQVVGGIDSPSLELGLAFYRALGSEVLSSSSVEAAEAGVLVESAYQLVQSAVRHELKLLLASMKIDAGEVFDLARRASSNTHKRTCSAIQRAEWPGDDALFLRWVAPRFGLTMHSLEWAGEIQRSISDYLIDRISDALNEQCKSLRGSKILLWPAAESSPSDSLEGRLRSRLRNKGASVECLERTEPEPDEEQLRSLDAVVVLADRPDAELERLVQHSRLVIDTADYTAQIKNNRDRIISF